MIPWKQIETTRVPGADVELRLMQRGTEFSMMLGQNELMNSRLSGSVEALATLACRRIASVKRPHLLIGPVWLSRGKGWDGACIHQEVKQTTLRHAAWIYACARWRLRDVSRQRARRCTRMLQDNDSKRSFWRDASPGMSIWLSRKRSA